MLQVLREIISDLRNPDPWGQALRQFEKRKSIEGVSCPSCGETEMDIWFYSANSRQKRNRFGDAWISCRKCNAVVEFHGVKIPDWYVLSGD